MKTYLGTAIMAAAAISLAISAEPPRPKLTRAQVDPGRLGLDYPMGNLGYPVGTCVQIEGVRLEHSKVGTRTLAVDTICGEKLSKPVAVWIDNVKGQGLPASERCVLRGYESARMIGIPGEVAKAENLPVPQAMWQLQRYFIVTSVVEPKELKKQ
jgi:hypothetical protein